MSICGPVATRSVFPTGVAQRNCQDGLRLFRARGDSAVTLRIWSTARASLIFWGSARRIRRSAARTFPRPSSAISTKPISPPKKAPYRDLVRGTEDGRGGSTVISSGGGRAPAPGSGRGRVFKGHRVDLARSSFDAVRSMGTGQARQCAIGVRMSGAPSCGTPSRPVLDDARGRSIAGDQRSRASPGSTSKR